MFPLVKLVFLLSILSGTANAQWGAVVAQPDTNRFINSQQDFGLIMPHQQVIVGKLDTTITSVGIGGGNASKVIVGSLLDHEDNCANYTIVNSVASCAGSYEKWRELEKSTSWYQADRGDTTAMFPMNYAMTISTGKDSVNIWNRDTAELWMAFIISADANENLIQLTGGADARLSSIAFKDGILYNGLDGANGNLNIVDILEGANIGKQFYNGAGHTYNGNIQQRNDGLNSKSIFPYGIVNRTVYDVAVTRDPFGLKDELGRPAHWWVVATAGVTSTWNPHTGAIYDNNGTCTACKGVALTNRGSEAARRTVSANVIEYDRTIFDRTADGYTASYDYSSGKSGNQTLPDVAFDTIDIMQGQAVVGRNADIMVIGGTTGAYLLHIPNELSSSDSGARQRWSATFNAPVEFGNAVLTMPLEDNTTDTSPYGNTMTAVNSPATVQAVFGSGFSPTYGSYLQKGADSDFSPESQAFSAHVWIKSGSATNRHRSSNVLTCRTGVDDQWKLYIQANGRANFQLYDGGATVYNVVNADDIYDAEWHHVGVTRDGLGAGGKARLYVDGVFQASATIPFGPISASIFEIGFDGDDPIGTGSLMLDDISYTIGTEMSPAEFAKIHAEGRKKLAMGTPVFANATDDALLSNNVVDIDALDNGMWAVAFSDQSIIQVFDGRIPVQQIAAPAGTVKSIALIQSPGTDSVGVAIGTTTNLKFVQPSVNLRAAMAHQYKEPIYVGESVVVDSAGNGGIFWTGNDALNAGYNAKRSHILFGSGTYGPFDVTQDHMLIQGSGPQRGSAPSGHGTLISSSTDDAIDLTGQRNIIENMSLYTPAGAGADYSGIRMTSSNNNRISNIHVDDADQSAVILIGGSYNIFSNWVVNGSDAACFNITGPINTIIGSVIKNCGSNGIQTDGTGDDSVFDGNVIQVEAGNAIYITSGANNVVCSGNRLDGAMGGVGCTDGNNTTAF